MVEGKPIYLVKEGKFAIDNFSKEALGQDEFFAELRLKGVSHLGQVEIAIIETNGGRLMYLPALGFFILIPIQKMSTEVKPF